MSKEFNHCLLSNSWLICSSKLVILFLVSLSILITLDWLVIVNKSASFTVDGSSIYFLKSFKKYIMDLPQ